MNHTRTWAFKAAIPDLAEAATALNAMRRMREAVTIAAQAPLKTMRSVTRERLGDLWWPNIDWVVNQAWLNRRGLPLPLRSGGVLAFQVGLRGPFDEVLARTRQLKLTPVRPNLATFTLPIFRRGAAPIHIDFRPHRPLPETAHFSRGLLVAREIDHKITWSLQFQFSFPSPETPATGLPCGVDIGWRIVDNGLRIATAVRRDGAVRHYVLEHHPDMRVTHLTDAQALHFDRYRLDRYRKIANDLCRFASEIHLEHIDWRRNFGSAWARRNRRWAAPGLLNQMIEQTARKYAIPVHYKRASHTTTTCSTCQAVLTDSYALMLRCPSCLTEHDKDENAGSNILHSPTLPTKRLPRSVHAPGSDPRA